MKKHNVKSSSINSIGETKGGMIVEFKGGARYKYFDVPSEIVGELIGADSVGKYFNSNILGQYKEELVST